MESKSLLKSVKSKIIIKQLFSYINEITKFKLVVHSKKFQNILNLTLRNYKEKCFESIKNINLLDLLSTKDKLKLNLFKYSDFVKALKNQFNYDITKLKIKKEIIDEYIEFYFTHLYNEYKTKEEVEKINILDNQLLIDIYSPFYEKFIKKEFFEKLFILYIPSSIIYGKDLMKDYYNATGLLKETNPEFSSFYFDINLINDLDGFEYFCKYFKKIKKLHVEINNVFMKNFMFPFQIFSLNNIKNNLIYLELKFKTPINLSDNFEKKLDELIILEELRLEGISDFHLTKKNLKYLYFSKISNLYFASNCFSNVEIINLFQVDYFTADIPSIKIPELKKFKVSFCHFLFNDIFDFTSCTKLKYFLRLKVNDFLCLGNTLLEKVYIQSDKIELSLEKEIEILNKLLEIKTLKEIRMDIYYINNEDIESIKGENLSVEKLTINWEDNHNFYIYNNKHSNKIILYGIQKKFPNLKEFVIYIGNTRRVTSNENLLEINPNPNFKINKFKYSAVHNICYTTIFYIAPYENLLDIEFGCMMFSLNLDKSFPLFSENCEYIFKSLIRFKLDNTKVVKRYYKNERNKYRFDIKIIKNVINNLDKMPNLKNFIFKVKSEIDEETYKQLIVKLLLSNIKNIEFKILDNDHEEEYSLEELENMFKDFNIKKFDNINITKFKK